MKYLLCLGLVAVTLTVFWQLGSYEFINFDDPSYILQNPQVRARLSRAGLLWAFTATAASNWHPIPPCPCMSHAKKRHLIGRFGALMRNST